MSEDSYPNEEALKRIREWDFKDPAGLMCFVKDIWWASDWGWHQKGKVFDIHTGGWSGNESIIEAMQANTMFWSLCWWKSERGGHYRFEIPSKKQLPKD